MQNSKLSDVKGKELVAIGHELAKTLSHDTPLIEIAKLLSEMATRLDCAIARGDALAAENVALKATVDAVIGVADNSDGITGWHKNGELASWYELLPELDAEFRETNAFLNSVRAEGVEMFAKHFNCADISDDILEFANQLRAGKDGE